MAYPPRPRHLRHVHEAFHAGLELDEGAVVGEAHHTPGDLSAHRVALVHRRPRVQGLLLVPEGYPARLPVEVQHHDLDLVPDLEDLRGVADPPPGHVGHMQQAVDAPEVDEGPVVRDVLHGPRQRHAFAQDGQGVLLLLLALLLQHDPSREDDVAPAPVQLDDLGADRLSHEGAEVLHRAEIHLRPRQEGAHAHVHREAALDHLDDSALHGRSAVVRARDGVPDLDLVRLVLGEDDQALVVLLRLEVDLDLIANLRDPGVPELLDGDGALALVADVHEHLAAAHLDDEPADHLPFFDVAAALGEPVLHRLFPGLSHLPLTGRGALHLLVIRLHILLTSSLVDIAGTGAWPMPCVEPVLYPLCSPSCAMARIISSVASRYRSLLRPGASALKERGGPNVTRTFTGLGITRPRGSARPEPET